MTGPEFALALEGLFPGEGRGQSAFARWLRDHGHPARDVARSVRRWAQIGPPGEVLVILRLMAERPTPPPPPTDFPRPCPFWC